MLFSLFSIGAEDDHEDDDECIPDRGDLFFFLSFANDENGRNRDGAQKCLCDDGEVCFSSFVEVFVDFQEYAERA